jgi:predicted nucleic acid-binding protein
MAIILDADVIIAGEKGKFDIKSWLAGNANERFEIAAITIAELWHGVEHATGHRRNSRLKYLQSVVAPLPIAVYSEETAYVHARIWAELEEAGKMIGYHDLVLASIALERGSDIATFNQKHFSHISGLRVIELK